MSLDLKLEYLYESSMEKRVKNSASWQSTTWNVTWKKVVGIYVLAFFLVAFSFHSGKDKHKKQYKKSSIQKTSKGSL